MATIPNHHNCRLAVFDCRNDDDDDDGTVCGGSTLPLPTRDVAFPDMDPTPVAEPDIPFELPDCLSDNGGVAEPTRNDDRAHRNALSFHFKTHDQHEAYAELCTLGVITSTDIASKSLMIDVDRLFDLGFVLIYQNEVPIFLKIEELSFHYDVRPYTGYRIPFTSVDSYKLIKIKQNFTY